VGYIGQFDQIILNVVEKFPSTLRPLMVLVTTLGSPIPCIVAIALAITWAYHHKNKQIMVSGIALIMAMPLAVLLKEIIKRVRPDTVYVQNMLLKTYSFPSSHAYSSLLACGFFAYIAFRYMHSPWKWLIICLLAFMTLSVGLSRVYLGAHFPSDILGGWILGAMVLALVVRLGFSNPKKL
jgi:undecaprenyl-diphosphatase